MLLFGILLSEILVQATLSPSPISSSPTPISHREFCRVPLPGDSIGVVHRATGVSIGCIGLVCVREYRCSSCSSCSSRSPTFSPWISGQPQDRATHGVLDLIIWYQKLLVTADLTFHPLDFVPRKFFKKIPKNSPKLPLDRSVIWLRFEWFWSVDLVLLCLIYYFPNFEPPIPSFPFVLVDLVLVWGRTGERKLQIVKSGFGPGQPGPRPDEPAQNPVDRAATGQAGPGSGPTGPQTGRIFAPPSTSTSGDLHHHHHHHHHRRYNLQISPCNPSSFCDLSHRALLV